MSNKHIHCPVCSSKHFKSLKEYEAAYLVKCSRCKFVFSEKIPGDQELVEHYEGYGRNDYLSPITIKRYRQLLTSWRHFRKNNRILDVGCGIGYFLETAKDMGWKTYGTEFTHEAIDICISKGIKMFQGKLSKDLLGDMKFDIITSFEVIEHINNPQEEISHIRHYLRDGGLLYLTTPNFNSISRRILKSRWNVIAYPEHLSYYTPQTLHYLLRNNTFKKAATSTHGISMSRMKLSLEISEKQAVSKQSDDEKIRSRIERFFVLRLMKEILNGVLSLFYLGDSIKSAHIKLP